MKRIEGFLDLDEVQSDMIERNLTSQDEIAFSIKGNFSWGFTGNKNKDKKDSEAGEGANEIEEET